MGRLVIKRKPGESIEIDGPCTITLLGSVSARICIEAPDTTHILRSELRACNSGLPDETESGREDQRRRMPGRV